MPALDELDDETIGHVTQIGKILKRSLFTMAIVSPNESQQKAIDHLVAIGYAKIVTPPDFYPIIYRPSALLKAEKANQ